MRRTTFAVVLASLSMACGSAGDLTSDTTQTATISEETTTILEDGSMGTVATPDGGLEAVVEMAKADISRRLNVAIADIEVLSSEEVTWPDGSLGCPEPGKFYTQALVEGSRILLIHDDRLFDYHGAAGENPFLCPSDEKDGGHEFVPPPGFDE